MTDSSRVWVLTSEVNDYDQHGEYLEKVFIGKPTREVLLDYFNAEKTNHNIQAYITHLLGGGSRRGSEDSWELLSSEDDFLKRKASR